MAGLDGRFVPEETIGTGVLPRLLRSGSMVDLPFAIAAMGTVPNPLDYGWWLASRSAGVVSFAAVSGSVILGLLMANGLPRRRGMIAPKQEISGAQ